LSTLLVDDHLLLRVLLDDEPPSLRPSGAAIATTGLWYHRLCRALANDAVRGSMSRQLGAVDDAVAADVLAAVIELPDTVELVSLRTLGWPMGELVQGGARLNLLSLEALAAAKHLSAEVCLAAVDDNEPLRAAASSFDVVVQTVSD
jgi:Arc/MetJ family transcription regulator